MLDARYLHHARRTPGDTADTGFDGAIRPLHYQASPLGIISVITSHHTWCRRTQTRRPLYSKNTL